MKNSNFAIACFVLCCVIFSITLGVYVNDRQTNAEYIAILHRHGIDNATFKKANAEQTMICGLNDTTDDLIEGMTYTFDSKTAYGVICRGKDGTNYMSHTRK